MAGDIITDFRAACPISKGTFVRPHAISELRNTRDLIVSRDIRTTKIPSLFRSALARILQVDQSVTRVAYLKVDVLIRA